MRTFPDGFLWGAATSAYQIEGSPEADGKGESTWDRFAHLSGTILDGSTGDVACDHYRRWQEDVAVMADLGLKAYRFSVSWPRIQPTGRGPANSAGLDFYDRLVDGLLEAGIEPVVTLDHWDLPLALEDAGGWTERTTAAAFADYAAIVAGRLGDRVRRWITHNEPWVVAHRGYLDGTKPPGRTDGAAKVLASHHLLLSHGLAVPAIRAAVPDGEVGITLNLSPVVAASDDPADRDAERRFDGDLNRWYLDPLSGFGYPPDVVGDYSAAGWLPAGLDFVHDGDVETIEAPTDFLGVNYYERHIMRSIHAVEPVEVEIPADAEITEMGWEVYPLGLADILVRVYHDYRPSKIYVTENGCSYLDAPGPDGAIHDERRVRFLDGHLAAAGDAIDAGVPLGGYFVWSILDNYEWTFGYTQRFGIVWVDYDTQERVLKDSALWYRDVIARNGLPAA